MYINKRIIARLDVKGNRLIKGIRFEGLRVIGDPFEHAIKYFHQGVDEIVYLDSVASLYGRNSLFDVLKHTSREVFIPLTAGGGIRNVEDARRLLASGADKVAVNTACIERPELISELARAFGEQCVVVSIQARRKFNTNEWECMKEAGREKSGKNVFDWIKEVQDLGAGEILLTSVDQDGTCTVPDFELNEKASQIAKIPLIVGGGFKLNSDILSACQNQNISAISIGASIHNELISISDIKQNLLKNKINVRSSPAKISDEVDFNLNKFSIGVIDYGMGNQQSLINSLNEFKLNVTLTDNLKELDKQDILALPGVGSFPNGMNQLKERNLVDFLRNYVSEKRPLIGICLGMQMLFEKGYEFEITEGLNLVKGKVLKMDNNLVNNSDILLPHIGWREVYTENNSYKNLVKYQYFVHSYAADEVNQKDILYSFYYYNKKFVAAIKTESIIAFQFHPERSGFEGKCLLHKAINDLLDN